MRILILEDTDERIKAFNRKLIGHLVTVTKNSKECIKILKENEQFDYIFLDHDLTSVFEKPGEGTGYEVAKWISEHVEKCPRRILIHSMNNIGAAAMMMVLGDNNIRASYIPLLWEKLQVEKLHA